jgi:hypothetical protein
VWSKNRGSSKNGHRPKDGGPNRNRITFSRPLKSGDTGEAIGGDTDEDAGQSSPRFLVRA